MDTLVGEAESWGVGAEQARTVVMETAQEVRECARNAAASAHTTITDHLPGYVTQAASALLEGRAVRIGLREFPTLEPINVV